MPKGKGTYGSKVGRPAKKKAGTTEKKRLDKVEKKYGGKKTGGVDTVVVRKPKITSAKTDGGMKTKTKGRADFIDGKTGKVERKRK